MSIFKPTNKQQEFIDAVFSGKYRFLFYGGAAGGGKSYVGIAILILLSKIFPGSKWHVIRKDYQKLKSTTIPTFFKVCPKRFLIKFIDGVAYFTNGSQIHFRGENFAYDKDLTWMDGLETNGFLLEEVQELQKKTFDKCKLRAGRNVMENMPPILVLCVGNPSQNWSKDTFVKPYKDGTLKEPYFFLQSLMTDNEYLPEQYKEGMEDLDTITYQRYVLGNWDVIDVEKPFAYSFNLKRHVAPLNKPMKSLPIYISFDFNVDPITAVVVQANGKSWIRFHKEYRLRNSNIWELCKAIREDHPDYYMYITGDASGTSRNAMEREDVNYYTIIAKELNVGPKQIILPSFNPGLANNRVLVNSLLDKYPSITFDSENCKYTIEDMLYCEVNGYGEIDKTKDKHKTHLLDCVRYYFNTFHGDFIRFKL